MLNKDILKEFIFDSRMRKLSEKTIKGYRNNNLKMFSYLEEEFGIKIIKEIKHLHIKAYIESLIVKGRKEVYVNGLIKCFRAYFRYALQEEYIKVNPMDKVRFQREPISLINTFNNEEVSRMIKHFKGRKFLDIRNQLIIILLLDTGIRNSELCSLRMSDVRETYINIIGKGKKERHVPITAIINKTLIRYLRVREGYITNKCNYETEYLMLSQKGRKLTVEAMERVVRRCGDSCNIRSEIRVSPHTCRHYYAQAQLKNGCDLFTVSRLLGHTNINITKRYLFSMEDESVMLMGALTSPLMNL